MQYVRALYFPIIEVVIVDPSLGPVYILKEDVSNRLYRIRLRPTGAPNLGIVFTPDRIR